jgi:hypothetical protein
MSYEITPPNWMRRFPALANFITAFVIVCLVTLLAVLGVAGVILFISWIFGTFDWVAFPILIVMMLATWAGFEAVSADFLGLKK